MPVSVASSWNEAGRNCRRPCQQQKRSPINKISLSGDKVTRFGIFIRDSNIYIFLVDAFIRFCYERKVEKLVTSSPGLHWSRRSQALRGAGMYQVISCRGSLASLDGAPCLLADI